MSSPRPDSPGTPRLTRRDPTITNRPSSSRNPSPLQRLPHATSSSTRVTIVEHETSFWSRCCFFCYNKREKTCCDRSAKSWGQILLYAFMYMIFLATYTSVFLYGSLLIVRAQGPPVVAVPLSLSEVEPESLTYSRTSIGLTATPTSVHSYPLIWYKDGDANGYRKYVAELDYLLQGIKQDDLGPCGTSPYGYGDSPCIIIRINKKMHWVAKPLSMDSNRAKEVPKAVEKLLSSPKGMYWLHCDGYHFYDKEHIGKIRYYPDPPGFDPDLYPADMKAPSQLIAVQISNFTLGMSLAVQCSLWYDYGVSTVEFMLYVMPKNKMSSKSNYNGTSN